jgi:hypothetical protein
VPENSLEEIGGAVDVMLSGHPRVGTQVKVRHLDFIGVFHAAMISLALKADSAANG